jgi:hypothetical protein
MRRLIGIISRILADGNSQLLSGKHSITTPPRRNIPMTGAKYGGSAERKCNTHNM